jgi:hypothetical protein
VVAVLEFPNRARRSFSFSVCSGIEVMEYARRRLDRGDRDAIDEIGEYWPGIVLMIGKVVVVEERVEPF